MHRESFGSSIVFGGPALVQSKAGVGSPENGRGALHFVGATADGRMSHWRRAAPDQGPWVLLERFGEATSGPCMIEGTYGAGNEMNPGNLELVVAVGDVIHHWFRTHAPGSAWVRSQVFGASVKRVIGMIQSSIGTNLELLVERMDDRVQHYWRDAAGWHAGSLIP